jgi:hypothetical protein
MSFLLSLKVTIKHLPAYDLMILIVHTDSGCFVGVRGAPHRDGEARQCEELAIWSVYPWHKAGCDGNLPISQKQTTRAALEKII